MSDNNETRTPKQALLGELESIKNLLDDSSSGEFDESLSDELLDIPILDDVVPELSNNQNASGLLDLDNIFDDLDEEVIDDQPNQSPLTNTDSSSARLNSEHHDSQTVHHLEAQQPEPTEPEASLQIDHLDADISFPSFTLDTAQNENNEYSLLDDALTATPFEAHATESDVLSSDEADQAFIDNANMQPQLGEYLSTSSGSSSETLLKTPVINEGDQRLFDDSTEINSLENIMSGFQDIEAQSPNVSLAEPQLPPLSNNPETAAPESAYDLDLMVQELVDEFIPPIEAELRKRLSECSPKVIVELAKKHLDN